MVAEPLWLEVVMEAAQPLCLQMALAPAWAGAQVAAQLSVGKGAVALGWPRLGKEIADTRTCKRMSMIFIKCT